MNTLLRRRLSFSPVDSFLFVFKSPYCPPEIKISLLLNRGRTDKRKTIISYFCHRVKTFQILTSTAFTFQGGKWRYRDSRYFSPSFSFTDKCSIQLCSLWITLISASVFSWVTGQFMLLLIPFPNKTSGYILEFSLAEHRELGHHSSPSLFLASPCIK